MENLIGKLAPDFVAPAIISDGTIEEKFSLSSYFEGMYGVVFFYPLDFTFVCPSEIIAFHHRIGAFSDRGARVVSVSIDSQFSHYAWRETPVEKGGIGQVDFPMVADVSKHIMNSYGVTALSGEGHLGSLALRATFVIDPTFVIRHTTINDLPLGRNVDEFLRIIDALKFHEEYGEVCPAGWQQGQPAMQASSEGVANYLSKHAEKL